MNETTQAPAGGMTSVVNGHRYEGGEFMPIHGMFCGKAGAKRLVKVELARKVGRLVELEGGCKVYQVYQSGLGYQSHVSDPVRVVVASSEREAVAAVNLPRCWATCV